MPKHQTGPRRLHSIPETAHQLGGLARSSVYKLIGDGELTRVHVGGRAFVTAESLDAYLARITAEAAAQSA